MSKVIILGLLLIYSCSHQKNTPKPPTPLVTKEFEAGEVILGSQLLGRIFDQEMGPISCVPDVNEASLLLRTLRPRMEVVQDDIEANLDDEKKINEYIQECDKNCTCFFMDDLLREYQIKLSKEQNKKFSLKKTKKELNRCLTYAQNTFCESELYKALNKEKVDFSFEE